VDTGVIMAATNAIAMDLAVCAMLGMEPVGIPVLKQAKIRGLWPADIQYPLLTPSQVKYAGFEMPSTAGYLLTGVKKPVRVPIPQLNCNACGDCKKVCPVKAISIPDKIAVVDYRKCIRCYCCHEVCQYKAINLEKQ
jgi:ferredoxin